MRQKSRTVTLIGMFVTLVGVATCYGGTQYEIHKIPQEVRTGMDDFDWVGWEWALTGGLLFIVGSAVTVTGYVARRTDQLRQQTKGSREQ